MTSALGWVQPRETGTLCSFRWAPIGMGKEVTSSPTPSLLTPPFYPTPPLPPPPICPPVAGPVPQADGGPAE